MSDDESSDEEYEAFHPKQEWLSKKKRNRMLKRRLV
jgi:hypothetical protein